MSKTRVQLLSLSALLIFVLSLTGAARFGQPSQESLKTGASVNDPLLKEIAGYKQWTQASEKPVQVFDASSLGG